MVGLAITGAAFLYLFVHDRERAAWLAMPAFWPWTQWYYASMAIPGVLATRADRPESRGGEPALGSVVLFAIAAAILAAPVTAAPAVALVVVAIGPRVMSTMRRGTNVSSNPALTRG